MSRLGVLALVGSCLFWGTTGTAASFLPGDVSPLAVGASTFGVGGLLLFLVTFRSAVRVFRDPLGRRWALIGGVGVLVYPLAFYTGMDLAGVAVGNVVALGSGPVFTALLEWFVERRPLSRRWFIATGFAVVGVALLASGRGPDAAGHGSDVSGVVTSGSDRALGVAVALLAGLAYALYAYASSRVIRDGGHPSSAAMGAVFGVGALALLPFLVVLGAPLLQAPWTIGIAAYLALGPTLLGYLLFGYGLRTVRSSTATTITLLEPVFATIMAVAVVGERLMPLGWGGVLLILGGLVVLVSARPPRKEPVAPIDSRP